VETHAYIYPLRGGCADLIRLREQCGRREPRREASAESQTFGKLHHNLSSALEKGGAETLEGEESVWKGSKQKGGRRPKNG